MRSSKRLSALTLVVVAAGLSLTACGPDDSSASGTTPSSSASAPTSSPSDAAGQDSSSGSGSNGGSGSGSTSGGSGSAASGSSNSGSSNSGSSNSGSGSGSGSASAGTCKTPNLTISSQHGISGEGQEIINFKNSGSTSCTLRGFPGVDLNGKDSSDAVSARRGGSSERPTIKLAPGEKTDAVLNYPVNNSGGSGYTFTTMNVTPPNETHSKTVSTSVNIPLDNPDQGSKPARIVIYAIGTGK